MSAIVSKPKIINLKIKKPIIERIQNANYLKINYKPKTLEIYAELKKAIAEKASNLKISELKEKCKIARRNEINNAVKINKLVFNEIEKLNLIQPKNAVEAKTINEKQKNLFALAKRIEEKFGAGLFGYSKERFLAKKEIRKDIKDAKLLDKIRFRTRIVRQGALQKIRN